MLDGWIPLLAGSTGSELACKLVLQWTDGLRQKQDKVIEYTLDGEDTVYCTVTGVGKSAAFVLPILIHQELARHALLYPNHPKLPQGAREKPVTVVVMPTKGLAGSMVRLPHNSFANYWEKQPGSWAKEGIWYRHIPLVLGYIEWCMLNWNWSGGANNLLWEVLAHFYWPRASFWSWLHCNHW